MTARSHVDNRMCAERNLILWTLRVARAYAQNVNEMNELRDADDESYHKNVAAKLLTFKAFRFSLSLSALCSLLLSRFMHSSSRLLLSSHALAHRFVYARMRVFVLFSRTHAHARTYTCNHRCFYVAQSYYNASKWPETLALLQRTTEHIKSAIDHHEKCSPPSTVRPAAPPLLCRPFIIHRSSSSSVIRHHFPFVMHPSNSSCATGPHCSHPHYCC